MSVKNKKGIIIGIIIIAAVIAGARGIYVYQKYNSQNAFAIQIAELSRGGPPQGIDDLRKAIGLYEKQLEAYVRDAAQTGLYWKLLGKRLQDKGLHNEALTALERALYYSPEDVAVLYMTGISAAYIAKSALDFSGGGSEADRYYDLAETAYLKSIGMDAEYAQPQYALGVLYVFELSRPAEAIPHLIRYLELSPNSLDGMFVLAGAYYMTEDYEQSVAVYDRIIAKTKDPVRKAEAEENRRIVLGLLYG
jgi:tetratricopeptide (TPR) repeat protein